MREFLCILIFDLMLFAANGQKLEYRIFSGISLGAPIPDKIQEDSKGWPGIMPQLGLFIQSQSAGPLQFSAGLMLTPKFARFSSSFEDVILEERVIWIGGIPVDTALIETFFSGKAKGSFQSIYLEIPVRMEFKSRKWQWGAGFFVAPLLYASNQVVAKGVVGFSVPPDSTTRSMDHAQLIRRWDYGVSLATQYRLNRMANIHLQFQGSLPHIYKTHVPGLEGKLRNRYLSLGVSWKLHQSLP